MKVMLTKTLTGWAPSDDIGRDHHRRAKVGVEYRAEIVKPRDGKNLRRWWALCNLVYQNCEQYKSPEQVHQHLKILAGHTTSIVSQSTGEVYLLPDSIDYGTLEEDDFRAVFKRAVAAVCEHILPGIRSYDVREEIEKLMSRVPDPRAAA